MKALSISYGSHDSSISLSVDDTILCVLELERITRAKKISASFDMMEMAALSLLRSYNLKPKDIDVLISTAPMGRYSDENKPDIIETKKQFLGIEYNSFEVRHHLAHAGMYFMSNFNEALISSCDGGGDGENKALFHAKELCLERVTTNTYQPSSHPYSIFSTFLYGSAHNDGKMMGLAALGHPNTAMIKKVRSLYKEFEDLHFQVGLQKLKATFPDYYLAAKEKYTKASDLAAAIQQAFVFHRLIFFQNMNISQNDNLVLVGGAALNLECNSKIYTSITQNLYIPPDCNDSGIAMGQNAIIIARLLGKRAKAPSLPYMGVPETKQNWHYHKSSIRDHYFKNDPREIAQLLADGSVILTHVGRAELGPRALGHRSFLANPLIQGNKKLVSELIKKREEYRPVAPIALKEEIGVHFINGPAESPYMLYNYDTPSSSRELLNCVVHIDGTARVQTVTREHEPFIYEILTEFKKITGVGILMNTSLNLSNEPLSDNLHNTVMILSKILHLCKKGAFIAFDQSQIPSI